MSIHCQPNINYFFMHMCLLSNFRPCSYSRLWLLILDNFPLLFGIFLCFESFFFGTELFLVFGVFLLLLFFPKSLLSICLSFILKFSQLLLFILFSFSGNFFVRHSIILCWLKRIFRLVDTCLNISLIVGLRHMHWCNGIAWSIQVNCIVILHLWLHHAWELWWALHTCWEHRIFIMWRNSNSGKPSIRIGNISSQPINQIITWQWKMWKSFRIHRSPTVNVKHVSKFTWRQMSLNFCMS